MRSVCRRLNSDCGGNALRNLLMRELRCIRAADVKPLSIIRHVIGPNIAHAGLCGLGHMYKDFRQITRLKIRPNTQQHCVRCACCAKIEVPLEFHAHTVAGNIVEWSRHVRIWLKYGFHLASCLAIPYDHTALSLLVLRRQGQFSIGKRIDELPHGIHRNFITIRMNV